MSRATQLSRRNFLTGRDSRATVSNPEQTFRLDLSGGCLTFARVVCENCGDACDEQAIRFPPRHGETARPVIDANRCTGCGDCIAVCPVRALSIETIDANTNESGLNHG